jgi:hypothetical protein
VLPLDYFDSFATAREEAEPFHVPWPMPGNPSSFPSFATFAEWRAFVLQFSLYPMLPLTVAGKFERAQKLYILTWIDFDLIKAGELVALTALELALTDRYAGKEIERRRKLTTKKAEEEKRKIWKGEKWWAENPSFADLLKHMVDHDGLTEDQIPMNRRCGPPSKALGMVTGETRPSLWDIRNDLAHGAPFGEFPWAGLLELVRDLINYAYNSDPEGIFDYYDLAFLAVRKRA